MRKLNEQALLIKFMACEQYSLALQVGADHRRAFRWMSSPHPGDLVVETSSSFRRPDDIGGVGFLVSIGRVDGDKTYVIRSLVDDKEVTWTNATFIRPISTLDDAHTVSSSFACADAVTRRANYKPWCRLARDVSFEDLGFDADEWTRLLKCRGCGEIMKRRRFSEDRPLCPTCHIPEPEPVPCGFCMLTGMG